MGRFCSGYGTSLMKVVLIFECTSIVSSETNRKRREPIRPVVSSEHTPVINLDHTTFHSYFMCRRTHQAFAKFVTRSFRATAFAGAFDTECFQNRLLIRLVFIATRSQLSPQRSSAGCFRRNAFPACKRSLTSRRTGIPPSWGEISTSSS